MILPFYQTTTVTALYPGETVENRQTYRDWENAYEVEIPGSRVEQGDTREEWERSSAALADFTAYLPQDVYVAAHDRLRFVYAGRERTCELEGEPVLLMDPLGILSHQVVALTERKAGRS